MGEWKGMLKGTKDLHKPCSVLNPKAEGGPMGQARRRGGENGAARGRPTARVWSGGGFAGTWLRRRIVRVGWGVRPRDGAEQCVTGVVERVGGIKVTDGVGDGVELAEGDAGLEEALGVVEGLELVVRGHHVVVPVAALLATNRTVRFGGVDQWTDRAPPAGGRLAADMDRYRFPTRDLTHTVIHRGCKSQPTGAAGGGASRGAGRQRERIGAARVLQAHAPVPKDADVDESQVECSG